MCCHVAAAGQRRTVLALGERARTGRTKVMPMEDVSVLAAIQ
jgi:hypothetical protein